jgi:CheY-like chemotaxis protein
MGLVQQMHSSSRRHQLRKVLVDPVALVKDTVRLLRPLFPSTIVINTRFETPAPHILMDSAELQQILMNLCVKAMHAMAASVGALNITVRGRRLTGHDLPRCPEVQPGKFVELTVGDTGAGIDPETLIKMFDLDFISNENEKMFGMRLARLHNLVTSYGGFVTCVSELGRGTVFHLYFPVAEQAVARDSSLPLGSREHILLIDDEKALAESGRAILANLGYTVTVRTSSLEAYAIFQNHPTRFDAVITDQNMPGMTGVVLAQQLLRIRSNLPIILCVGNPLLSEETVRSIGIKGLVIKPLSATNIAAHLREVFDQANVSRSCAG